MPSISEIVNVNISRETSAVTRASFGVMMHLSLTRVFDEDELTREYTNVADMLTDGFKTTDTAYIAANALFSQEVSPESVIIGERGCADAVTLTPTAANSTAYTVTINGTAFTYTSDGTATVAEICAGLTSAINAGAEPVTATDNTTTVGLAPDVATTYYSVTSTANIALGFTAANSIATDLANIREINDTWYGLTTHLHTAVGILEVAAAVESLKKIYGYSTYLTDILDAVTTDVASDLSELGYDRTFGFYDAGANTTFGEAAWFGVMLPKDPGSATWKFKTLTGVTDDGITTTQSTRARGKNCNTYETIGGVAITREGVMASGEFIDVIVGADWMESRIEENVYSVLVNSDKIPYTDAGGAVIENQIRGVLQEAVEADYITSDFTVTVPKVSTVSSATKATRVFPTVTFAATLAGAIHKTNINGVVSV